MYYVYRIYDKDNSLLYVGCTSDFGQRMNQHHNEREWGKEIFRTEVEVLPTKREGLEREGELVKTLSPRYNIRVSTGDWMGANQKRNFVQIIIRTSEEMKKLVRQEALEEDRSMNQVINSALRHYFKTPKGQGPRKRK